MLLSFTIIYYYCTYNFHHHFLRTVIFIYLCLLLSYQWYIYLSSNKIQLWATNRGEAGGERSLALPAPTAGEPAGVLCWPS